jgi:hypothetical protein
LPSPLEKITEEKYLTLELRVAPVTLRVSATAMLTRKY